MLTITSELVGEFLTDKEDISEAKAKLMLCRAVNSLSDQKSSQKELVFRLANNYAKTKQKAVIEKKEPEPTKKKRGRKPSNKGKKVLGGTKNFPTSFWNYHDAIEKAVNDEHFPNAISKGNYQLVKTFLKEDWANVDMFRLPDLLEALEKKYPDQTTHNGFTMQRWGDAYFWRDTIEVAVKPLWKQFSRNEYHNIFYQE
jgi:hypothetical protein